MRNDTQSLWWPRLAALGLSALAAGSVVFWVLKWPASLPATNLQAATQAISQGADRDVLARALGANAAAPGKPMASAAPTVINATSRMALVGVVANAKNGGSALISIDGKPARPVRVGTAVDADWLLQSVTPRQAVLASRPNATGSAGATGASSSANNVTLELPLLKK